MDVRSGIDWFELHGEVDYGEADRELCRNCWPPLRRGDTMVRLGDGSFGLLPEEWLERFAPLAGLGTDGRGSPALQAQPGGAAGCAAGGAARGARGRGLRARARAHAHLRRRARRRRSPRASSGNFAIISAKASAGWSSCASSASAAAWRTIWASARRRRCWRCWKRGASEGKGPSLVVAPKSLMFNWRAEAARFTPQLRVLEHTGLARDAAADSGARSGPDHLRHACCATRRSWPRSSSITWCWMKRRRSRTPTTASAKAVRLLRGAHRLALSGTPVENHLGELWSLFEFLNPGMLGEAQGAEDGGRAGAQSRRGGAPPAGARAAPVHPAAHEAAGGARTAGEDRADHLLRAGRPRRRKQYDDLRQHYRETLLHARHSSRAWARSKMHVLEALLRLRQAACHPGLLDAQARQTSPAPSWTC